MWPSDVALLNLLRKHEGHTGMGQVVDRAGHTGMGQVVDRAGQFADIGITMLLRDEAQHNDED